MDIVRVKSTNIVKHIEPHLVLPDEELKMPFLEELVQRITHAPDSLLILAGIEDDEVRAFLIAQNPGSNIPYSTVVQVWSHVDNESDWHEPFLAELILWSTALGKSYIRAETPRNAAALHRRFGFEPYMTVSRFDLSTPPYRGSILMHVEELLNGQSL